MQQCYSIIKYKGINFFSDYVENLLDLIFEKVVMDPTPYVDEVLQICIPEDLKAQFQKPDKLDVIASYV